MAEEQDKKPGLFRRAAKAVCGRALRAGSDAMTFLWPFGIVAAGSYAAWDMTGGIGLTCGVMGSLSFGTIFLLTLRSDRAIDAKNYKKSDRYGRMSYLLMIPGFLGVGLALIFGIQALSLPSTLLESARAASRRDVFSGQDWAAYTSQENSPYSGDRISVRASALARARTPDGKDVLIQYEDGSLEEWKLIERPDHSRAWKKCPSPRP